VLLIGCCGASLLAAALRVARAQRPHGRSHHRQLPSSRATHARTAARVKTFTSRDSSAARDCVHRVPFDAATIHSPHNPKTASVTTTTSSCSHPPPHTPEIPLLPPVSSPRVLHRPIFLTRRCVGTIAHLRWRCDMWRRRRQRSRDTRAFAARVCGACACGESVVIEWCFER